MTYFAPHATPCPAVPPLHGGGTWDKKQGIAGQPSGTVAGQAGQLGALALANKVLERRRQAAIERDSSGTESGKALSHGALKNGACGTAAADLVRCADCRHVHYRSEPPPIPGNPWKEWLVCDHGHSVTMHELETRARGCAQFHQRTPAAEPMAEGSAAA